VIDEKQLQSVNIYHRDRDNEAFRTRKEWTDFRATEEGSYEKVLKPSAADNELFGSVVLSIAQAVIKGELEGHFPSFVDSKYLLKSRAFSRGVVLKPFIAPHIVVGNSQMMMEIL